MLSPGRRRQCRDEVLRYLELLAGGEEKHAAAFPEAGPDELPALLCRLWFDEIYLPSERYVDALKAQPSPEVNGEFFAAFSAEELEDLERFHQCFELRLRMLPPEGGDGSGFFGRESWRHIQADAARLLKSFG